MFTQEQLSAVRDVMKEVIKPLEVRFDGLEKKVDEGFKKMDEGFEKMDEKIDTVQKNLMEGMDEGFDMMDKKIDFVDGNLTISPSLIVYSPSSQD
jgi:predicted nucleotide-binding protein (sugar kinase/HSP70/actin superfamily)